MSKGFLPDGIFNPWDNVFSDPMTADLAYVHMVNEISKSTKQNADYDGDIMYGTDPMSNCDGECWDCSYGDCPNAPWNDD